MRRLEAAGSSETPGPGASSTGELVSSVKRSKASTACNACKLRRGKCSQGQPTCSYCEEVGIPCIYDRTADKRRNRPRKASKSAEQQPLLDSLLYTIRHGGPAAIDRMVGLVRDDGMNPDELASRMEELQKTLQPTEQPPHALPDLQPASTNRAMNVSYLTSTSPIEVKAKPWTKVAEDSMVSHLISIFMVWERPFFPMIDRQRFLSDFVAANTETASACSPLLVNAMCARACYLSDDVAKYNRSSRRAPLADLFFEEARRHLDAEAWRPSINSIAALYLMYLRECHEGRDRPAVIYRLSAIEMYEQLGLGRLVPDEQSLQENQEAYLDWRLAFAASWGCFMMECVIGFWLGKAPPIRLPYDGRFLTRQHFNEIFGGSYTWVPYPLQGQAGVPAMLPEALFAAGTLGSIIYDIHAYNARPDLTTSTIEDVLHRRSLHQRLEIWEQLTVLDAHISTLPHVFFSRYLYYQGRIAIVRPLTETELVLAAWGSPRAMEALYCRQMFDEFWALRENIGARHMSCFALGLPLLNLSSLVAYLDPGIATALPDSTGAPLSTELQSSVAAANSHTFYRASLVCHEFAEHYPICAMLLRIVRALAHERGIVIPLDARKFYPPLSPALDSATLANLDVPATLRVPIPAALAQAEDQQHQQQQEEAITGRVSRHQRPVAYESIGSLLKRAKRRAAHRG